MVSRSSHLLRARFISAAASIFLLLAASLVTSVPTALAQSTPSIDFISPTPGATFAAPANIPLRTSVNDPENRIRRIEYWANESRSGGIVYPGAFINSATIAPYPVTWPNVTGGTHKITAIGKDAAGNFVLSVPITVVVTGNPNIRPSVRIREPIQDSSLLTGSDVTFKVDASDADGSISCVRFSSVSPLGFNYLGQDCSPPFSFLWNRPGNGDYEVQALAIDNVGQSNGARVDFSIGNRRPSVSISSPTDGSTLSPGQHFTVTATATDSDGRVEKVEFWDQVGGTQHGTDSSAPYTQALVAPQNGRVTVVAVAYDNHGATNQSTPVRLDVVSYAPINIDVIGPQSGASFAAPATVPISVAVSDPQLRVTRVEFVAHTVRSTTILGSDSSAPYAFSWNAAPAGEYHLSARAYTTESGEIPAALSLQVPISIFAANAPPAVSLTAPDNFSTFIEPADIRIAANASDSDGSIAKVEFHVDGAVLATDDSPPYEVNWRGVTASDRLYVIQAKAFDQVGAHATSASRSITVNPPPRPPEVALLSPKHGQSFGFPVSIQIAAAANDVDGKVNRVEFYVGDQLVGSDAASPFVHLWSPAAPGNYSLIAKAVDNSGLSTTSEPVQITSSREVLHFYHSDAQGSIVAVTNAQGQQVGKAGYRPFGLAFGESAASTSTRIGFAGKLSDRDLSLTYFGARHYDPLLGRFLSIDPAPYAPSNLHSFNRYAYANNNPLTFDDLDGQESPCFVARQGCGIWKIDYDTPEAQATIGALFAAPMVASGGAGLAAGGVMTGVRNRLFTMMISRAPAFENGVAAAEMVYSFQTGAMAPSAATVVTAATVARGAADELQPVRNIVSTATTMIENGTAWTAGNGKWWKVSWSPEIQRVAAMAPDYIRNHPWFMKCCELRSINNAMSAGRSVDGAFMGPVYRVRKVGDADHGKWIEHCPVCRYFMDELNVHYLDY